MAEAQRLIVEALEDRTVPATYGLPWLAPNHLTLSFAPDETRIAGHFNQLFDILDAQFGNSAVWQQEFVRAFQTWAIHGNLSVGLKVDDGTAFGGPGRLQGDPRFGDIRVAAHQMSPEVLSISVPPDPFLAGPLAGDIFLNSAATFTSNNLFPVLLHEIGHVLGLEHSDDPQSVMHSHQNRNTRLTRGDIEALQALYGVRGPDEYEPNNDFASATPIRWDSIIPPYLGLTPLVTYSERWASNDVDYFWVEPPPLYMGPVTFRLQTAGLSFLAPRLTVYNSSFQVLGHAESASPFGDVLTVRVSRIGLLTPGFYIRVDGPADALSGIGRYGLSVSFDDRNLIDPESLGQVLRGPYDLLTREGDFVYLFNNPTSVLFNDDLGTNFSFGTAERLRPVTGYQPDSRYQRVASLSRNDVDFFRMTAPANANVLTVTLTEMPVNGVVPVVFVYNADRQLVLTTQVLLNGNGTYTVQATGLEPGTDHYLKVQASPRNPRASGNYLVTVDFGADAAVLETFAFGDLSAIKPEQGFILYVGKSQLFQFLLSAEAMGQPGNRRVTLDLLDSEGNSLFSLRAGAGESASDSSLFLLPGEYRLRFRGEGDPPEVSYRLRGVALSDPIGPVVEDPAMEPLYTFEGDPSLFRYPDGYISSRSYHVVAHR